jgi:hypothetical protein
VNGADNDLQTMETLVQAGDIQLRRFDSIQRTKGVRSA